MEGFYLNEKPRVGGCGGVLENGSDFGVVCSVPGNAVIDVSGIIVTEKVRVPLDHDGGYHAEDKTDFLFGVGFGAYFDDVPECADVSRPTDVGRESFGGDAAHG